MLGVRVAVGRQFNPLATQDDEVTAEEYAQVKLYLYFYNSFEFYVNNVVPSVSPYSGSATLTREDEWWGAGGVAVGLNINPRATHDDEITAEECAKVGEGRRRGRGGGGGMKGKGREGYSTHFMHSRSRMRGVYSLCAWPLSYDH